LTFGKSITTSSVSLAKDWALRISWNQAALRKDEKKLLKIVGNFKCKYYSAL